MALLEAILMTFIVRSLSFYGIEIDGLIQMDEFVEEESGG